MGAEKLLAKAFSFAHNFAFTLTRSSKLSAKNRTFRLSIRAFGELAFVYCFACVVQGALAVVNTFAEFPVVYLLVSLWVELFAFVVVFVELWAIAWIQNRYMNTPFFRAAFQVVLGGALVFGAGVLIGSG